MIALPTETSFCFLSLFNASKLAPKEGTNARTKYVFKNRAIVFIQYLSRPIEGKGAST